MSGMTWNENYSVGIPRIDDDHKRIVGMINKAFQAYSVAGDKQRAVDILSEMRNYAEGHFQLEETYMREHGYPDMDEHLAEHAYFRGRIEELEKGDGKTGTIPDPVKVYQFLSSWLISHIMYCDRKMGDYLTEKGVS